MVSRRHFVGALTTLVAMPPAWAHEGHEPPVSAKKRLPKAEFNASVAIDPDGQLWSVCKEGDHAIVRHAERPGAPWSLPVRVNLQAEGIAADGDSRPKIAVGPKGEVYVSWTRPLGKPYTGEIRFARSLDGGQTFSLPITVHVDRQEITHRFDALTVTPNGDVVVVWIDKRDQERAKAGGRAYRGAAVYFAVSVDQGQSFLGDHLLAEHSCECCRIALLPQADGSVLALWRHVFEPNIRDHAMARFWPDGTIDWVRRASFDDWRIDACPHHGPSLAQDGDGAIHAVWYADGAARYGQLPVKGEGPPVKARRLSAGAAEHADIAAVGREVVVTWREYDGQAMTLRGLRSADAGSSWREFSLGTSQGPTGQPAVLSWLGRFYVFWHGRDEPLRILEVPKK